MPSWITEASLRAEHGLAHGSEVHLPQGARLTPSASQLLAERKIRIKYIGDDGRVFLPDESDAGVSQKASVHPLTSANVRPGNRCAICHSHVEKKTELLTLLDGEQLVPKTHPRIALRGKLDTLISQTVWVQTQFAVSFDKYPVLCHSLADLRSFMGNLLRSEVTGEVQDDISMGDLDDETIHQISHQPLKYLGHDHIVPELKHGANVSLLNVLRAMAREAEVEACKAFQTDSFGLTRPDIVQGLNRLSSALYVLMLMTLVVETSGSLPELGVIS
ncbi:MULTISPECIES: ethanolamine utilization cob(I)yrinic acid a,c-diamide adenosyltransferase EutT [unclassified Marinobacter]|jgi:ethanolamine utilization cobalamin adenosyltransferase|uniref:ethanolamine utilization cob(I)yrinic acid a,c-diamide adenosyltransferase EutT n=1 Tax=unclassified Marinobacter TaxID=83889 RepID=UPI0026E43E5B|nr:MULTISPECIES: ethanolamine utilization cob(I)yrinic acid a,c-diamide adenosyltransferase EutT [unclassified Marinobacter]MDO6442592.1 ethanolamine utilization cob(I)yrinic acid a,c-diamide adenosyltransferase EutT [Marinobacter sp. 2_MG-2023]MDO6824648.1 ethanolamine utilization cob(I)yrinic acid a,c-diamide adenosyltransferase EutT [Marinobacter sp. 1_MG-2023]